MDLNIGGRNQEESRRAGGVGLGYFHTGRRMIVLDLVLGWRNGSLMPGS